MSDIPRRTISGSTRSGSLTLEHLESRILLSSPSADLYSPADEGIIQQTQLNAGGDVAMRFMDDSGSSLDEATITDADAEFTLEGEAAAGVEVDGAGQQMGDGVFQDAFTGTFGGGEVLVNYGKAAWQGNQGSPNEAERESFTVLTGEKSESWVNGLVPGDPQCLEGNPRGNTFMWGEENASPDRLSSDLDPRRSSSLPSHSSELLKPRTVQSGGNSGADLGFEGMSVDELSVKPGDPVGGDGQYTGYILTGFVRNFGDEESGAGTCYYHLSEDQVVDDNDPVVTTYSISDNLVPGQRDWVGKGTAFDAPATPGTYYLRLRLDMAEDANAENDWSSMVTVNVVDGDPHVTATNLTVEDSTVPEMHAHRMFVTLRNDGPTDARSDYYRIEMRPGGDPFDPDDWGQYGTWGPVFIGAGETKTVAAWRDTPTTPSVTYELRATSDDGVSYTNTENITVTAAADKPVQQRGDIYPAFSAERIEAAPGEVVETTLQAFNQGFDEDPYVPGPSPGTISLWRSNDPTVDENDVPLTSFPHYSTGAPLPRYGSVSLAVGETDSQPIRIMAPHTAGTYYVAAYEEYDENWSAPLELTVQTPGPEGQLTHDFVGGHADMGELNELGYLEASFDWTNPNTIDGGELTLHGDGAGSVTLGEPQQVEEGIYRYPVSGEYTAGPVEARFEAGEFSGTDGTPAEGGSQSFTSLPDISPFAFSADPEEFSWDSGDLQFEYAGDLGFGMKPEAGGTFDPMLTINDAEVGFDGNTLSVDGNFTTSIGEHEVPLMQGTFVFPLGETLVQSLNDSTPESARYEIAGTKFELTNLEFVTPAGEPVSHTELQLQGRITLPEDMGGSVFSIEGDHSFVISPVDGLSITGGEVTLPDIQIFMYGGELRMDAVDMSVEFRAAAGKPGDPDYEEANLRFRGRVSLPYFYNATADFTRDPQNQTDSYIQVSETGDVEWFGTLSAEDIVIVPGQWELNSVRLTMSELPNGDMKTEGEATVTVPPGLELDCGLGFVNGDFNFISLGADNLDVPLGTTGAFLQGINGEVDHVSEFDPVQEEFGGSLRFTAGPEVNVSLPTWAGGNFAGSLADIGLTAHLNEDHLWGNGTLDMVEGLVTGTADADLNWKESGGEYLEASGELQALEGLVSMEGSFHATSKMDISMAGTATITLPDVIPLYGGTELYQADSLFRFTNDANYANDYYASWGTIPVGKWTGFDLVCGSQVDLDGTYRFLGAKEVAELTGPGSAKTEMATAAPQSFTYDVTPGSPWVVLGAEWENQAPSARISLASPNGTVYSETDIAASNEIAMIQQLTDARGRVAVVRDPAPGQWELTIADTTGLVGLETAGYLPDSPPEAEVTSVMLDPGAGQLTVGYTASDPDATADLSFYLDEDDMGGDGILIGAGIAEEDGAGVFRWTPADVPTGDYYVYLMAHDGVNPPTTAYSSQSIHVPRGAISGVNFHDQDGDGTWDGSEPGLEGWTIYLDADDDGELDPGETSTVTGPDGSYRFNALEAGTYVVREQLRSGWEQTSPGGRSHEVDIGPGGQTADVNFGNRERTIELIQPPIRLGDVTYAFYDIDTSDGITEASIALNMGEFVSGKSDILLIPGGNASAGSILLFDGEGGTEDLGIAVVGNQRLDALKDLRSNPAPIGFLASEGSISYTSLRGGIVGADLNGFAAPDGWTLPADLDDDGDDTDSTGIYSASGVGQVIARGDVNGDCVSGGDLSLLYVLGGDLNADIVLTGSDIGRVFARASYDRGSGQWIGGSITGDITTPGSIHQVVALTGSITGDIDAGGDIILIKAMGDIGGDIHAEGDLKVLQAIGGDIAGAVDVDGSLATAMAVEQGGEGGNVGLIDVEGDLRVLKAIGGDIFGPVTVSGNATLIQAVGGDIAGGVDVDGSLATAMAVEQGGEGGSVGVIDVGSDLRVLKAVGGDIGGPVAVGGNATLIQAFGGDIKGLLDVEGNLQTAMAVTQSQGGGITGGVNVEGNAILLRAIGGDVTHPVEVGGSLGSLMIHNGSLTGELTAGGDLKALKVVNGDILGSVNVSGKLGAVTAIGSAAGGNVEGVVHAGDGLRSLYATGDLSANLDVTGTLRALSVRGSIQDSLVDVKSGSLHSVWTAGDINSSVFRLTDGLGNPQGDLGSFFAQGDLSNTTIQAGELGKVLVRGQIWEDDSDDDHDEIHALSGRYFAMDQSWQGWVDDGTRWGDHWFDEGEPDGVRACVV